MYRQNHARGLAGILIVALCGSTFLATAHAAEQYKQIPLLAKDQIRPLKSEIRSMVRGAPLDQTKAMNWYGRVVFASMTQPSLFAKLPDYRLLVIKDLQDAATKNPAMYAYVKNLAYSVATKMVNPESNYHPAVRYNAMLLIGALNDTEAVTVGSGHSPETDGQGAGRDADGTEQSQSD